MDEKTQGRFWSKVEKHGPDECWEWQAYTGSKGYGTFKVDGKTLLAHRFSYEIVNGPIKGGLFVRHKCDNPRCVNPKHLELGTHADNMRDMVERGRGASNKGTSHGRSKLTENEVREIRANPRSERKIAADFNISPALVGYIRRRKLWTHI